MIASYSWNSARTVTKPDAGTGTSPITFLSLRSLVFKMKGAADSERVVAGAFGNALIGANTTNSKIIRQIIALFPAHQEPVQFAVLEPEFLVQHTEFA